MATQTVTIGGTTYSSTTADTAITLTDDAFGIVQAVSKLTEAIRNLQMRLNG